VNFWDRLDTIAARKDVLRHPFYVRWSGGTLTREELAAYAGQYRHAVVALAAAASAAARSPQAGDDAEALATHATEESAHIDLWDQFVAQVGGDAAASANRETLVCAEEWAGDDSRPLLHTLTAMYAIESAQPAISHTKLTGLTDHYGIESSLYFEVHQSVDVAHAAQARELIDSRLADADEEALLRTAERVLDANWLLLDGVDGA
jgi:pyrroloquinoline-quinone synthase